MTLSEKREATLKRMPSIETRIKKSQDGKFLIHQTTFTDIKPVNYYDAVISSEPAEPAE